MKKYILIAGVNGVGKSTLYQSLASLQKMPRINTDEIVRAFGNWNNPNDVIIAGKIAIETINYYLNAGVTFIQLTYSIKTLLHTEKAGTSVLAFSVKIYNFFLQLTLQKFL